MNRLTIAFYIYLMNAICMLFIGLIYQFSNQFMPYHSDVIQMDWHELTEPQRVLYIGMMRTEAAGFLASSLAIIILLYIPFRQKFKWATYAISIVGIVEYLPSAIATYHVSSVTEANPPWLALLIGILLFIVGLLISLPAYKTQENKSAGI